MKHEPKRDAQTEQPRKRKLIGLFKVEGNRTEDLVAAVVAALKAAGLQKPD